MRRRLISYFIAAEDAGADIIFNTCSSVGEVSDMAAQAIGIPVLKIDEAMTEIAALNYNTIGVIATLDSTLGPTARLVQRQADRNKRDVTVVAGLAQGAYLAAVSGDVQKHDALILAEAERLAQQVEVLVLAQGSMARMEDRLRESTGKPVLSSINTGLERLKTVIDRLGKRRLQCIMPKNCSGSPTN